MSFKSVVSGAIFSSSTNPFAWKNIAQIPRYLRHKARFKKLGGGPVELFPILSEFDESAGVMSGHYFHQDLYVARRIFQSQPRRHFDVGSRIDGFVAHVASFMEVHIFDVRELHSKVPGIHFERADLMAAQDWGEQVESLSCLHTLEHFGLGRYGDPVDPKGHLKGFKNMVDLVSPGGTFYLSFPIGSRERVEFNAHRVFHPRSVLSWPGSENLTLEEFSWVDDQGDFHGNSSIEESIASNLNYGCGIYVFRKSPHN